MATPVLKSCEHKKGSIDTSTKKDYRDSRKRAKRLPPRVSWSDEPSLSRIPHAYLSSTVSRYVPASDECISLFEGKRFCIPSIHLQLVSDAQANQGVLLRGCDSIDFSRNSVRRTSSSNSINLANVPRAVTSCEACPIETSVMTH